MWQPAEAVNSTEPSEEASDAEASGAETAPAGSATEDASREAAASAELCNASSGAEGAAGLAEELETLARDLESHFAKVSLSALSRLPPDARRRPWVSHMHQRFVSCTCTSFFCFK